MSVIEMVHMVRGFIEQVLEKQCSVIGVVARDDGWTVEVEVAEETEYMRQRGRDDLLALYHVYVDGKMQVSGYGRVAIRERDNTQYQNG